MAKQTVSSKSDKDTIRELKAQLAAAKSNGSSGVSFKVGPAGGLSMYGLGQRYPITLYAEGWEILLANVPKIEAALKKHAKELKRLDTED